VFDAYIGDSTVLSFLKDKNPEALREMSERLREAQQRGLWRPRLNSAHLFLNELADDQPLSNGSGLP